MRDVRILCSISTRNRYENYLPMAMASVLNQTRSPDHFRLHDDNDDPKDLRQIDAYLQLFKAFDAKGISWDVVYGQKKGQHHNHQAANKAGFAAVWRIDDDCVAESNVLEKLEAQLVDGVGAVGGIIRMPNMSFIAPPAEATSMIDDIDKPNRQWFKFTETEEVDHLHCAYLYRAGIADFDMRLSKKAHREETLHTYSIKLKGYKVLITPCITWHLKAQAGGIRSDDNIQDYQHDEWVFGQWLKFKKSGKKLYVLNCGLGDHYAFLQAIKPEPDSIIACCYPDMMQGHPNLISIAEAMNMVNVEDYNVYKWCGDNHWEGTLIEAFKKLYENISNSR